MRSLARRAAPVVVAALLSGVAGTAAGSDATEGYRLARQWCSSCHIVAPGQPGSDAAPPFEAIASAPNFSDDGLRAWLADPHPPMPNLNLSRDEIEQIISYLRSLRQP